MNLEQELRALASDSIWPDAPDVTGEVRRRIELLPTPRRRLARQQRLVIALALLAAALAAALAVPEARTAILRALGIGSVRVEIVDDLPPLAPRSDLTLLGTVVPPEQAVRLSGRPLLRFDADIVGEPDEIRLHVDPSQVSYVWGSPTGVRLLVSDLPGRVQPSFIKLVGPQAEVEEFTFDGQRALWITGDAHGFGLQGGGFEEIRLSGNALLVDHGETTIRIEGDLTREQAIRVYRAIR